MDLTVTMFSAKSRVRGTSLFALSASCPAPLPRPPSWAILLFFVMRCELGEKERECVTERADVFKKRAFTKQIRKARHERRIFSASFRSLRSLRARTSDIASRGAILAFREIRWRVSDRTAMIPRIQITQLSLGAHPALQEPAHRAKEKCAMDPLYMHDDAQPHKLMSLKSCVTYCQVTKERTLGSRHG